MAGERYPFVAIDVAPAEVDEMSAELFSLGATGVEERDEGTLVRGAGGGKVTLVGSFGSREDADEAVKMLDERFSPRVEEVVGDAWRDAWKEHFAPFALTPKITIVPPWVDYARERSDEEVLVLEPGRAFGTGLHASTSMVAELIDEAREGLQNKAILDVGCGSGILALVALMAGASRAMAIDVDPDVIEVVRENAERNALADRVDARAGTADTIHDEYPFVVANIEARVLRVIAADLARTVAPGGMLVLSGILAPEHDEMVALYTSRKIGLSHRSTRRRGDAAGEAWCAIAFERPS